MSYSNNDDKKSSGLLLTKRTKKSPKETGLPIFNINDLTDGELKILIQNFFENDGEDEDSNKYDNKKCIYMFFFENKAYWVQFIGEKNEFKVSIIKFLNFLKNIMVEGFSFFNYDYGYDVDIINLIGNVIKNSKVIKSVFLPGNFFKNKQAFEILYKYLKNHESLISLNFGSGSMNKLSDKNIGLLIDVIKFSIIEDIDGLHKDDYKLVFDDLMNNFVISKNPRIKCVDKSLNDDLVLKLSNTIKERDVGYLIEIDFSSNSITSKGFSILVDSLLESNNKNIVDINMTCNELDDDCIEKLGELIKKNENIKHIDFSDNYITDKGIEKLSEYIVGNISIKSIKLYRGFNMSDDSLKTMNYMIKSSSISSIGLCSINTSAENIEEIERLLKIPIEKREIPLMTIGDVKSASKRMKKEET